MLFFMPESPRWLFSHDRDEEAVQVLGCLSSSADETRAETEAEEIRAAIIYENSVQRGWLDLFKEDNVRSRWRVALAIGLQSMQPFSGVLSSRIIRQSCKLFEPADGEFHSLQSTLAADTVAAFRIPSAWTATKHS